MVFDECVNWRRYLTGNRSVWCRAFELLRSLTPDCADGRIEEISGRLYVNVFGYEGKPIAESKIEAHRQFIDIQTLIEGEEEAGCQPIAPLERLTEYDAKDDYELFKVNPGELCTARLRPGNFVIFFPGEGHTVFQRPENAGRRIRKAVVKIDLCLFEEPGHID